jgi:hypothetical protein
MSPKDFQKGKGITPSEKHLVQLAEKSFLKLWSFPNVFNDTRKNGKCQGKELCDLLVVCGDYILIFSDKTISWNYDIEVKLAWARWYRAAIKESAKQISGAMRRIELFPNKLYLDANCKNPFPFILPPPNQRRTMGIIVANGSAEANRRILDEGTGSFMLFPSIKGDEHLGESGGSYVPFAVGDVNPDGVFMHVLDEVSLRTVMKELDTITDFVKYFEKRGEFIRSGRLISAFGEEDLLGYYLSKLNKDEEHDFTPPKGKVWKNNQHVALDGTIYNGLKDYTCYQAKEKADQISYLWDYLIEEFTKSLIEGTHGTHLEHRASTRDTEFVLRHMASEGRFQRRILGIAFSDVLKRGVSHERYTRLVFSPSHHNSELAYLFLSLKYPNNLNLPGGFEQYRQTRLRILYGYCLASLKKQPGIKRVIGISTEPFAKHSKGRSEDLCMLEQPEWTEELLKELEEHVTIFDIFKEERLRKRSLVVDEYPISKDPQTPQQHPASCTELPNHFSSMNRKQRRSFLKHNKLREDK